MTLASHLLELGLTRFFLLLNERYDVLAHLQLLPLHEIVWLFFELLLRLFKFGLKGFHLLSQELDLLQYTLVYTYFFSDRAFYGHLVLVQEVEFLQNFLVKVISTKLVLLLSRYLHVLLKQGKYLRRSSFLLCDEFAQLINNETFDLLNDCIVIF